MLLRTGSLRIKVLRVVLLTTLTALLVAMVSFGAHRINDQFQTLVADMETQQELLGHMTAPALAFNDRQLAYENLALLHLRPQIHAAALYSADGELFAQYIRRGIATVTVPKTALSERMQIEGAYLIVSRRVDHEDGIDGTVYMRVDHQLGGRLIELALAGLLAISAAMAVAYLLAARLQRTVSQPILRISDTAREVMQKRDYSRRADVTGDDEVGILARSFNDMLSEIEHRTRELEQSYHQVARQVEERTRAEHEVLRLNAELEQRVLDRTAALEQANRDLVVATAAAEQGNRAKTEFLSSMSHELRTPLNAILGFGQLLASDNIEFTPEKRLEFSEHITHSGEHLLDLINEVLDLSRIEAGALLLSMEPVSVADVVAECCAMIEPLANERKISFGWESEQDLHVLADTTRFKQVLLNLLSNAIKYNVEHGNVRLRAYRKSNDIVRVSVRDTGKGLSPEEQAQLFQPFNRLGAANGAEQGTGIGLVLTRRLVELMGGGIDVHSEQGWGSEFSVELRAVAAAGGAGARTSEKRIAVVSDSGDAACTILCVEDNPVNLRLVREIVATQPGFSLLAAADGATGIQLCCQHLPDLILLDIELPGIDGFQVARILASDPATAAIPIIGLSSSAMPDAIAKGMSLGFLRYLTKPIDVGELLTAIHEARIASARRRDAGGPQPGDSLP